MSFPRTIQLVTEYLEDLSKNRRWFLVAVYFRNRDSLSAQFIENRQRPRRAL